MNCQQTERRGNEREDGKDRLRHLALLASSSVNIVLKPLDLAYMYRKASETMRATNY